MAYDGSIIIDTQIDSSSVQNSLKKLEMSLKTATRQLDSIDDGIKDVVNRLKSMQEVKFDGLLSSFNDVVGTVGTVGSGIAKLTGFLGASAAKWGLVGLAAGATMAVMAGGLTLYLSSVMHISEETQNLIDTTNEMAQANEKLNETLRDNQKARQESLVDTEAEIYAIKELADELFELNDQQEKTVEDKEKMQGIVDRLNETVPGLKLKFDEETGALEANKDEIYKTIDAKMALVRQNAAMDTLTDVYKDQYKAQFEINSLLLQRQEILDKINEIQANPEDKTYDLSTGQTRLSYSDSQQNELRKLKESFDTINASLDQTRENYAKTSQEIDLAYGLMTQSSSNMGSNVQLTTDQIKVAFSEAAQGAEGNTSKMRDVISQFGSDMVTSNGQYSTEAILAWQNAFNEADGLTISSIDSFFQLFLDNMDKTAEMDASGKKNAQAFADGTKKGLDESSLPFSDKTQVAVDQASEVSSIGGLVVSKHFLDNTEIKKAPDFANPTSEAIKRAKEVANQEAPDVSATFGEGIETGLSRTEEFFNQQVTTMVENANSTGEAEANKSDVKIGAPFAQGTANGIKNNSYLAVNAAIAMVQDAIIAAKNEGGIQSPSKVTRDEIGKPLVQGLVKGLDSQQKNLNKSMGGLLSNMLSSGKKLMGIHSPSTVMRDEIGAQITRGIEVGIHENSEDVLDEFDNLLDALNDRRELDIISEEEYYAQLEALTREHLDENSKQWREHMMEVYEYQQKMLQQQKDAIGFLIVCKYM